MLEEITSEKGLPQNLEAERSVLGAILLDPAALSLRRPDPLAGRLLPGHAPPHLQRDARALAAFGRDRRPHAQGGARPRGRDREGRRRRLPDGAARRGAGRRQRRALRPDRQGEVDPPPPHPGGPEDRPGRAVRGAGRRGPAGRGDRRDLRHRRRRGPGRVRGDRAGRAPQPRDHRGRPRPAGHAVGPRDGVHRARPDDLGPAGHGPDHHRGAAVGRKDLVRPEHRPARRHPRGPLGRLLLAGDVQGAARLPRALLRGRRRREESPRRVRLQGGDAAARPGPVQDPRRRASSSTTARP